ncbi:MAG: glycosyltransferase [Clostridia bacterium]|nr:glycosyltransferase [Clostridia bacterium]
MKILWTVNIPIDILGEKIYGKRQHGLWMDALLNDCRKNNAFDLIIATTAKLKSTLRFEKDGVTFYALPDKVPVLYNGEKASNQVLWNDLINKEKPDIVQIWGTEFAHGLCAIKAAKDANIPSVIYMQGYLGSISRHYLAGMTVKEIKKSYTLRDFLKHDSILNQQKKFHKNSKREKEEFMLSGNIICENDWCEASIRAICPSIKSYRCPLSVNETFSESQWSIKDCERHSIICNASGYPLKGLHMLLRAVALLKKKYPDIKLYVPGEKMAGDISFISRLRKRGYRKYIEGLVKRLNIEKNIVWLGNLSQGQLAERYLKANAFVMCSAIENHSSSLKEAMMVGVPCIASAVGGVPEYVKQGENGFLYRFEEYDIAASYIERVFDNDDIAEELSENGRSSMLNLHKHNDIFNKMLKIYTEILSER